MNLWLPSSLTKSSETPVLLAAQERPTSETSGFSITFDDLLLNSDEMRPLPDTVEALEKTAPEIAEADILDQSVRDELPASTDKPLPIAMDIDPAHLDISHEYTPRPLPALERPELSSLNKQGEQTGETFQDIDALPTDESKDTDVSMRLDLGLAHARAEHLLKQDVKSATTDASPELVRVYKLSTDATKDNSLRQAQLEGPSRHINSSETSKASVHYAVKADPTHQPLTANDGTEEPPAINRSATTPLSMLERHLSGLPVTLISPGAVGQQSKLKSIETTELKETSRPSASNSLTTPLPLQAVDPAKSPTPTIAQNVQIANVRVAVAILKQSSGETEPFVTHIGEQMGWDQRPQLQSPGIVSATHIPKAELAGSVTQQIVEAVRRSPDRPIEIALSPVELGRVRMVLSASDAGITVNILADRPDTLDLLRRNIDDLGKSFSEIGYKDISFSFERGDQMTEDNEQNHSDSSAINLDEMPATDTPAPHAQNNPILAIAPDGIDMRL